MKFNEYLHEEIDNHSIDKKTKNKINNNIIDYLKPEIFEKIPLKKIFSILEKNNLVPINNNGKYWNNKLKNNNGLIKTNIKLGFKNEKIKDKFSHVSNDNLVLIYEKIKNKWKVSAYIG